MADLPFFMPKCSGGGDTTIKYKTWDPSISENGIIDFTLVDGTSEKPPAVDMNPYDEWTPIEDDEEDGKTDYIWEPI